MRKERILVVDDEQLDLFLIQEYLAEEPLILDLEADPTAAWWRLEAPASDYSLVIVDRAMPGLDGLGFLRRMKENPRFADIPVIVQTGAAVPEQVREGLQAGAYYYLTKPYSQGALVSIVRSAVGDYHSRLALRHLSRRLEESRWLMQSAEYRFSSLQDINALVPLLAGVTAAPAEVAPGLADLMLNAVEHGNLEITYAEKSRLKLDGDWEAEIARRLALPKYRERFATIRAERLGNQWQFTIADQGGGFDWRDYLDFDPSRAFDPNGRGIAMAHKMSFLALEYRGKGNIVVATAAAQEPHRLRQTISA
ncbi:MAG: response regulator [Betaproteobacteria bacterium]